MSFNLSSIMEKMVSSDKDYRYMATSDLIAELNKETFKVDPSYEQRLVTSLLNLLKDTSNNIQELAVKCMGPLVKKIKEQTVMEMINTLADNILKDKNEELRDVSTMALRTLLGSVAPDAPSVISGLQKSLYPRLLDALKTHAAMEVRSYCLDLTAELLARMGKSFATEATLTAVVPMLQASGSTLRKRAISCIGLMSAHVNDALFGQIIERLVQGMEQQATKSEHIRTYIQCFGAIASASATGAQRLGNRQHLGRVVPVIARFVDNPKFNQDDELRENCFGTFESLLVKCQKEMVPHVQMIIDLCLKFIKYDPNYADEEEEMGDEEEAMETEEGEEEAGEEEEEELLEDDDDMSWKVRRASAKCLTAIIATRMDLLLDLHAKAAPALISRFREREENVKMDVFNTFATLLRQTAGASRRSSHAAKLQEAVVAAVPRVVSAVSKQLKEKSLKTRAGAFSLAKELVTVAPGCLNVKQVSELVPAVVVSLGDRNTNSTLKVEALTFLRMLLVSHQPQVFHPHVAVLVPLVVKSMTDSYFRIAAEGLRVASELVAIIRPASNGAAAFDHKPFVQPLYTATLTQLKAQDTDQEVKECALLCIGAIVSLLGDELHQELSACLSLLLDRLRNEITRISAVKVVARIAASPLNIDLSQILSDVVVELGSYLRKSNRQLRQSALVTLTVLVEHQGANKIAQQLFPQLLNELVPLVSDTDLFLGHLAICLASQIIKSPNGGQAPEVLKLVQERLLPQSFELVRSTLLQGVALQSVLALLSDIAALGAKGITYEFLVDQLLALASAPATSQSTAQPPTKVAREGAASKQSLVSIAQAVAAVSAAVKTPAQRDAVVLRLLRDIQKSKDDTVRTISLLCIGEIGRTTNLSAQDQLLPAIMGAFDSLTEEIRQAASFALGNVTVGCMDKLLSFVLQQIGTQPAARQYLLLHSLREIIVRQSSDEGIKALRPFMGSVLKLLFAHCESEEEGTRNVVSECLGKLAIVSPSEVVPEIDARAQSTVAAARVTAISSVKYAVNDLPNQPVDALLEPRMEKFMMLVADTDLHVRRAALLALNYVAHHKPTLVRDFLPRVLPSVLQETKIRPELIREVDLGPFKHKVDDGVDTRKAAFECLNTLLDCALDRMDIPALAARVGSGMSDHYDVKLLTHLIILRLASLAGVALLEHLDTVLVGPLRDTILTKPKDSAVKQEVERNDELVRSALRAVAALSRIPNADHAAPQFKEFMRTVVLGPEFADRFREISKEDSTTNTSDFGMAISPSTTPAPESMDLAK